MDDTNKFSEENIITTAVAMTISQVVRGTLPVFGAAGWLIGFVDGLVYADVANIEDNENFKKKILDKFDEKLRAENG